MSYELNDYMMMKGMYAYDVYMMMRGMYVYDIISIVLGMTKPHSGGCRPG